MDDLAPAPGAPVEHGESVEPRTPHRLHALKDKDTFVVADSYGDILGAGDGLFHNDTRILSRFRVLLGDKPPSLLSAAIAQDNVFFTFNGANQALPYPGGPMGPPGVLHLERKRFLWEERLYERITCTNYSRDVVLLPLSIEFGADFQDMFEVRGMTRARRGHMLPPVLDGRRVRFTYVGLDQIERASVVAFSDPPGRLTPGRADFMYSLAPEGRLELYLEIGSTEAPTPSRERFRDGAARARWDMRARRRHGARMRSSGRLFNEWLEKSRADLALLTTRMETGPYPYAGIPWFSTAFGRDAIITAWQILWFEPSLAKGVLTYLAAHQAEEISAFRDSAPGKIMHETRKGEMPALGEVPFGRYYGGVDTTPLFVALAGAYAERTGDMALIDDLWPALKAATAWMEHFGDTNGDGLIDYARGQESGLANQGWKDSQDSVFHADGRFPNGPIALVEVQGYAFAAYKAMARFAGQREDLVSQTRWSERAEHIRETVEDRFWMEDQQFYGIAIDGDGVLCRTRTSNPGHLLFCGLPSPERAAKVTEQLLSARFDSGWGVRTLATGEARYNPMSYHNGSVWPHDTAVCAMGLSRYGERDGVVNLTSGLFETAASFEMRLPELFCGFGRNAGEPPVNYPVACLPQAWAAGSVFMMLQACLGIGVNGAGGGVEIIDPRLPIGIDVLAVDGLRVGEEKVDLLFERIGGKIVVQARGHSLVPVRIC
ncbi:MAG: amylo-alpha-1,6-glucosidase [Phenylobacterium sp.]|uniref:amylo-alpha-1,6-glucosidase n=1 Tax=Phenylobacterium sp. TaxID=1871053 RepID=UPI002731F79D|nr:amylo-alpha-1,6-glucosidase [Phenylobacterium sp.]MDP2012082.1 amylo-alpha-1,6-glucosidase [Phenylobacterium sp.]